VAQIPPHKQLLTYRYAEIIFDLTDIFVRKLLPEIDNRRTREQMVQAARSGKQNIIEGTSRSKTSRKSEITLLDVARASLEELTADYEDFLRARNLDIWSKTDPRVQKMRLTGFRLSNLRNLSSLGNLIERPKLPERPIIAANFLLTLCHQATFLLARQIASVEKEIIEKGGYTEELTRKRLEFRNGGIIKPSPRSSTDRVGAS
jgi:four helix bundle suffix protein